MCPASPSWRGEDPVSPGLPGPGGAGPTSPTTVPGQRLLLRALARLQLENCVNKGTVFTVIIVNNLLLPPGAAPGLLHPSGEALVWAGLRNRRARA